MERAWHDCFYWCAFTHTHTHTHTHLFNGPFSGTTCVSRYQKGKTNLDFTEARDSEWQWHQLGHMQVCISLQTVTMPVPHHSSFFTGRMPFLPPNQQRQSTEGIDAHPEAINNYKYWTLLFYCDLSDFFPNKLVPWFLQMFTMIFMQPYVWCM